MSQPQEPVGFIGLGVMGSILAGRLLAAGFPLVVHNRTASRQQALVQAGAMAADSPQELARRCRHVFLALTGPQALQDVLFGAVGICSGGAVATEIVCDLSTQDPAALKTAQATLRARGIGLAEAPMAGSVHDASQGTLQFLHGGDPATLAALAPYFACWGPPPIYFGGLGSATTAKLALNLLLGLMATGLADAMTLLRRSSVSEPAFIAMLANSGLRSPVYQRLWDRHAARDYGARFSLGNLKKDLLLVRDHPAWDGRPPALLAALAERMLAMPADLLQSDYSRVLDAPGQLRG